MIENKKEKGRTTAPMFLRADSVILQIMRSFSTMRHRDEDSSLPNRHPDSQRVFAGRSDSKERFLSRNFTDEARRALKREEGRGEKNRRREYPNFNI